MRRKFLPLIVIGTLLLSTSLLQAVEVVPIGETIKPEGGAPEGGAPRRKAVRKRPPATQIKAGKSFMVESAEAVSAGLSSPGETVYFRSVEEVGTANRPVIFAGALATGKIVTLEKSKQASKLAVKLDSIEAVNGEKVTISGDVEIEGEKTNASYGVGERFTATINEQINIKGKHKPVELPAFTKSALAEIRGKGVDADIKKGVAKGKVEVILESSKNLAAEDIVPESVALYRVNNKLLPRAVGVIPGKNRVGDSNKNGNSDLTLQFAPWDFIKFQPRGNNSVYFKGKLKDGSEFDANTKVTIDY